MKKTHHQTGYRYQLYLTYIQAIKSEKQNMHHPRVEPSTHEQMQQPTFVSHPRVRFTEPVEIRDGSEEPIQTMEKPSQLIVASPNEVGVTQNQSSNHQSMLLHIKMTP